MLDHFENFCQSDRVKGMGIIALKDSNCCIIINCKFCLLGEVNEVF